MLMPDAEVGGRDVVVQFHDGGLKKVHETNRSFDPLHFVLLFPGGDDGWKINMEKQGTKQSVTPWDRSVCVSASCCSSQRYPSQILFRRSHFTRHAPRPRGARADPAPMVI